MITERLSDGRAASGANSSTVRTPAMARVADAVLSSAKSWWDQFGRWRALVEVDEASDIARDDADRRGSR